MKVIAKPTSEEKVLASVKEDAKAEEIRKGVEEKGQDCIDQLCGCSCDHAGC